MTKDLFYKYLKVCGILAKMVVLDPKKLIEDLKIHIFFIEDNYNSSIYQFIVLKSSIENIYRNTIMKSRNDIFFKDVFEF